MSVVKHISDRIAVLYLGEIVESGSTDDVFSPPYHPYTESLLSAVPEADPTSNIERILLDGTVPNPRNPPKGCSFHTRCSKKIGDECENIQPGLETKVDGQSDHEIACHLSTESMDNEQLKNR
jgi:peptide/nickel transport system ATP-binding protein